MRPKNERVRNTVMAALLLVTLLLGARLAEGAVNSTERDRSLAVAARLEARMP